MSLSDKQFAFAKDVMLLLNFAVSRSWKFTIGEAQRTKEQQRWHLEKGRTTTLDSLHIEKMAIDIFFFKPTDGGYKLTMQKKDLQELGDFWESLSNKNEWGGNWETFLDTPHFQRNK